jgi:tRNA 2-thiouridine synthesizing protein A
MADHHLDLKGLKCPLPALRTGKALAKLQPGEVLHVTCTDGMAAIDIPHLVQTRGDRILEQEVLSDHLYFMIERLNSKQTENEVSHHA